jgi:hypothetical protein
MKNTINIGIPPNFWIIQRPGRQWAAYEMEPIVKLLQEDGFRIVSTSVWPLCNGSEILVSHSEDGAATLFLLKYSDILRKNQLTLKHYEHNVKQTKEWVSL